MNTHNNGKKAAPSAKPAAKRPAKKGSTSTSSKAPYSKKRKQQDLGDNVDSTARSSTCRELRTISSYLFPFILSLSIHLISATFPSALPIVPFRTAAHPLFHFYRSFITCPFCALPYTAFSIVLHFLRCLTTASFIVLHCFALPPCSIPTYTASVIVLYSTSTSISLIVLYGI
jgi:hypothetical protein